MKDEGTTSGSFEIIEGAARAPWVLTCEHASHRLPSPWRWSEADLALRETHWAWDPGAAEITRELAAETDAPAVLSRFTRLLIDPNRDEHEASLIRREAEGRTLDLNAGVDDADRARRLIGYHRPFHAAIDNVLARTEAPIVFSVHTFNPVYEGQVREVEVGVLFNLEDTLGHALLEHLRAAGFRTEPNEPWSGKAGLIFSAESHANRFGIRALEIEVRNDLAIDPDFRARLVPRLAEIAPRLREIAAG